MESATKDVILGTGPVMGQWWNILVGAVVESWVYIKRIDQYIYVFKKSNPFVFPIFRLVTSITNITFRLHLNYISISAGLYHYEITYA